MANLYKVVIQKQKDGKQWWWKIVSRFNGKIISTSETYKSRASCVFIVKKVIANLHMSEVESE